MSVFLGIDTSNYTTSLSLYDTASNRVEMEKRLLPVKSGQCGLRQSDAVFLHVKQLGELAETLFARTGLTPQGIGYSAFPRRVDGSYMPCFLVGEMAAQLLASAFSLPVYSFSHQEGHIAAALYSAGALDWLDTEFYAFHVSGGTTEGLLVSPGNPGLQVQRICATRDLHAGQVIDRVGVMLGLNFPCGSALEQLAAGCTQKIKVRPVLKDCDCCLSGIENQCQALMQKGESREYIARFCLESVLAAVAGMTRRLLEQYGPNPLVYAGGVMSNRRIRSALEKEFHGLFAQPQFSSDNSAGIAVLAARQHSKER